MNMVSRRRILTAFAAGATALYAWSAQAQAPYPNKPVRFIVPYSPGGLPDTVARVVGQALQERIGQTVVVENRSGSNGWRLSDPRSLRPPDHDGVDRFVEALERHPVL